MKSTTVRFRKRVGDSVNSTLLKFWQFKKMAPLKSEKKKKKIYYTHFTFIVLYNIYDWCINIPILWGQKENVHI